MIFSSFLLQQLAAILITRQIIGNLKEAFLPYLQWKAKLYKVGYEMTKDLISPDSKASHQFQNSPSSDSPNQSMGELSSPGMSNMGKSDSVIEETATESDQSTLGVKQRKMSQDETQGNNKSADSQSKQIKPLSLTQAEVESAMKQVCSKIIIAQTYQKYHH